MEWDDEADGYCHRVTGEIYEAVDLTEVPDDYFARGNEMTLNPVWARYVSEQMLDWLNWLRNIHLKSYLDLSQRFIELNPYYSRIFFF